MVDIETTNPSEALECLEEIYDKIRLSQYLGVVESAKLKTNYNIVKRYILKAEKEHNALEIIKEKEVDVFRFKKLDFDTFNQLQKSCKLPELTKEEFNLLKEVLG